MHYLFKPHIPALAQEDSTTILNTTRIFRPNCRRSRIKVVNNPVPSVKQRLLFCFCYCSKKNFEKVPLKTMISLLSKQVMTLSNHFGLLKHVTTTRDTSISTYNLSLPLFSDCKQTTLPTLHLPLCYQGDWRLK